MEEAARDIHPNVFHVVACEVHLQTFINVLRKGARKSAAIRPISLLWRVVGRRRDEGPLVEL